jgi:two-component system cell cycle response regulator
MSGGQGETATGWIHGLELACEAIEFRIPHAGDSAKRIAKAITRHLQGQTDDPVIQAAHRVEVADENTIPVAARGLLDLLRFFPLEVTPATPAITTVLVVDDDPIMRLSVTTALQAPRRRVLSASSANDARRLLSAEKIDLMVLDLVLPDMDGRNFLVELRESMGTASMPIFVLSGQSNRSAEDECFSLGANEFIAKPFDPGVLASSVTAALRHLQSRAPDGKTDARTSLPNRAAIREHFEQRVLNNPNDFRPVSLVLLDFEELRAIAELRGQIVADQVLKTVARALHETLRGTGIVGRWGGDEFVAIFEGLDAVGAQTWLDRAMRKIRDKAFTDMARNEFHIVFTAGLTNVTRSERIDEVVARAERLLFAAKRKGPGTIVSDSYLEPVTRHSVLVAEDDAMTLAVVKNRLENEGFNVIACLDGEAAYNAALADPPAVIITDVNMPKMDGFTLVYRLRLNPGTQRVPILILTSLGKDSDIARGVEVGANDYMAKPFSPIELSSRVHRLLRRPV